MRLIDADALIERWNNMSVRGRTEFDQEIMVAPTIDICFCKECKHRKPSGYVGSIKTYKCDITGFRMHDQTNHFCSYGEREEQ